MLRDRRDIPSLRSCDGDGVFKFIHQLTAIEGFDPEVIAAARAMKTPLVRFGGNFVSGYHWMDGGGDPEKRRTILNQAWGLREYNQFSTDEFRRLCPLIGAEADRSDPQQ